MGDGVGGVLVGFESPRVQEYLNMAGQDPEGDQSPGSASGRT